MGFLSGILGGIGSLFGPIGGLVGSAAGALFSSDDDEWDPNEPSAPVTAPAEVGAGYGVTDWFGGLSSAARAATPYLSYRGQSEANAANLQIAREQMDFQRQSQQEAERYNTEMANTAYQRGVGDLRQAGLNPMLALSRQAPSPSVGVQSGAQAHMENPMHSAAQAMAIVGQLEKMDAEIDRTRAETKKVEAETVSEFERPENIRLDTSIKRSMSEVVWYQIRHEIEKIYLTMAQEEAIRQQIKNAIQEGKNLAEIETRIRTEVQKLGAEIGLTNVETILKRLDVPHAANQAAAEESAWKKHVSPYIGDLGRVVSSGRDVAVGARAGNPRVILQRRP